MRGSNSNTAVSDNIQTSATSAEDNAAEKINFASLPLISCLPNTQMKWAKELLEELDSLEETKDLAGERIEEIKLELEAIQKLSGKPGLRYDDMSFAAIECSGRNSLDRIMLMENGVTAEVIEKSMKLGRGFVKREFVSKGKKERARKRKEKGKEKGI